MEIPHSTLDDLETRLKEVYLHEDTLIKIAIEQAIISHRDVQRYSGVSVLEQHIFPVAISVIDHELSGDRIPSNKLVASSIVHDIQDDNIYIVNKTFKDKFGDDVCHIVRHLVDKNYKPYLSREELLKKKLKVLQSWWTPRESRIIFFADRDNNLSCMYTPPYLSNKTRQPTIVMAREIEQTHRLLLPFAQKQSPYYFKRISAILEEYNTMYPSAFEHIFERNPQLKTINP